MRPNAPEYSESEVAILIYLFNHPDETHSTQSLTTVVEEPTLQQKVARLQVMLGFLGTGRTESERSETSDVKPTRNIEEVEKDVENLIAGGLVRGKRKGALGNITYAEIKLTYKGEQQAIMAKKRFAELDSVLKAANLRAANFPS
ncbi:hypothetical protein [Granulicella sp. L46]|uniref:hypothetical protein n=1 Tax=Granulicella sp. L46 TaxID=1641865 RepID=UPI00131CFB74|nr:hypothetical protein [Granulicella sp. L46]